MLHVVGPEDRKRPRGPFFIATIIPHPWSQGGGNCETRPIISFRSHTSPSSQDHMKAPMAPFRWLAVGHTREALRAGTGLQNQQKQVRLLPHVPNQETNTCEQTSDEPTDGNAPKQSNESAQPTTPATSAAGQSTRHCQQATHGASRSTRSSPSAKAAAQQTSATSPPHTGYATSIEATTQSNGHKHDSRDTSRNPRPHACPSRPTTSDPQGEEPPPAPAAPHPFA